MLESTHMLFTQSVRHGAKRETDARQNLQLFLSDTLCFELFFVLFALAPPDHISLLYIDLGLEMSTKLLNMIYVVSATLYF